MEKEFIAIKIGINRYRKIYLNEILYCKADRAYSVIKTDDSEYTFSEPLKNLENLLTSTAFIRVNRSYIVNLTKCIELKTGAKPEIILINKEVIKPNSNLLSIISEYFNLN